MVLNDESTKEGEDSGFKLLPEDLEKYFIKTKWLMLNSPIIRQDQCTPKKSNGLGSFKKHDHVMFYQTISMKKLL